MGSSVQPKYSMDYFKIYIVQDIYGDPFKV